MSIVRPIKHLSLMCLVLMAGLSSAQAQSSPLILSALPTTTAQQDLPPYEDDVVPQLPDTGDASELDLTPLDSKPNVLHGIEGLHQGRVPLNAISPNTLKTFVAVVDLVRREYTDATTDEELFAHAIRGMLTKVDSHAEFLDEKAFANLKSFTSGNVADIGVKAVWQEQAGHWVVSEVANDSSAMAGGIKVGDYLHQIGDVRLGANQSQNDVAQLLNGIQGTKVDVSFSKAGRSKITKTLERTHNNQSKIELFVKDGIVIVKLPVFQTNTREQILNGLASVGVPVQGMIIDVRNNPGGVLESAVAVASLFMRNQVVTQVQGREGIEKVLNTTGSAMLDEIPVIIVQNRYSASAAEVLASSLQTQKRALILGETSYGKGSVQSVIPIGDNQAVKLTTAHYITAKGDKIDKIGVKPDVAFTQETPIIEDEDVSLSPSPTGDDWLDRALLIMQEGKLAQGIEFAPVGGF